MSRRAVMDDLFAPEPHRWGLRGDPYVWQAMRERLAGTELPASVDEAGSQLRAAFREVVGVDLADPAASVHREAFAHGGMSSGMVCLDTWRDRLIPLLVDRARAALAAR